MDFAAIDDVITRFPEVWRSVTTPYFYFYFIFMIVMFYWDLMTGMNLVDMEKE